MKELDPLDQAICITISKCTRFSIREIVSSVTQCESFDGVLASVKIADAFGLSLQSATDTIAQVHKAFTGPCHLCGKTEVGTKICLSCITKKIGERIKLPRPTTLRRKIR